MTTEDTTLKSYISEKIWDNFNEIFFPSYNFTTEGVVLREDIQVYQRHGCKIYQKG